MRESLVAGEDWVEGSATVTSCRGSWSNAGDDSGSGGQCVISFCYEVAGRRFIGKFEQYEPLAEGTVLTLLYNPERPGQNSLAEFPVRGWRRLIAIGIGLALAGLCIYLSERYGIEGK